MCHAILEAVMTTHTYSKPATSIDQQLQLLKERGMSWDDEGLVIRWLETVGYYRLSAYWLPWETPPAVSATRSKSFAKGTMFEDIVNVYIFDRQLRLLVMEAIERVEISLRSRWTNRMTLEYGSHAHLNPDAFKSHVKHAKNLSLTAKDYSRSSEQFISHYKDKYKSPDLPPLWAATELMTFGALSHWLEETKKASIKQAAARDLGLPTADTLVRVTAFLSYARNLCAHHQRLWNRRFVKSIPLIKNWRENFELKKDGAVDNTTYNLLVLLAKLLLHQSEHTTFPKRVADKVSARSRQHQIDMGFPENWAEEPIWSQVSTQ